MKTLDAARARLDQIVSLGMSGTAIVVVPPGAQSRIAAELANAPDRSVVTLDALPLDTTSAVSLVAGLPSGDSKSVADALSRFNGMRDLLRARKRLTVLVVSRRELAAVQRYAGDTYSVRIFIVDVAFEPDLSVDAEEARRALGVWYRERLARLDLRGFVRSESEDVAWSVEDLYQDVSASEMSPDSDERTRAFMGERSVSKWLASGGAFVVLGHPGAGKSFLLRWLALTMTRDESVLGITRPLPVLASLATYAEAPGPIALYDHLVETLLEGGQLAAHALGVAASEKRAVFLLDGLDEVGDESSRARVVEAIEALRERAPGCLLIATSRIAGYDAATVPNAKALLLSPFDDGAITRFLRSWCELYAVEREGDTPHARREGAEEGERLARDVLAHHEVLALARNPLLLTVIAIVHRAGVRLPDHRVELYDHATRILVERWNRVRSLGVTRGAPPMKSADAVRLLGPVALAMIRSSVHGVISEQELRRHLDQALSSGALRGLATADEAIALFRNALGLLVEQAPGVFAFMHLTLAEYFAAWELVRSDALEVLAAREADVFRAGWREVMLLAAGVLGVLRADDERLDALVERLIDSAGRRRGKPSPSVPLLLSGLLADDPGLSSETIDKLAKALVPTWWFERRYGARGSLYSVVFDASRMLRNRLREGRAAEALRREIRRCYGEKLPTTVAQNLQSDFGSLGAFMGFLQQADVDNGPAMLSAQRGYAGEIRFWIVATWENDGETIVAHPWVSRAVYGQVLANKIRASLVCDFWYEEIAFVHYDLRDGELTGACTADYLQLEFRIKPPKSASDVDCYLTLREA